MEFLRAIRLFAYAALAALPMIWQDSLNPYLASMATGFILADIITMVIRIILDAIFNSLDGEVQTS